MTIFKTVKKKIFNPRHKILRAIEFDQEYFLAGLTIINYFGVVLRNRMPDSSARVRIEQDQLKITLIIETAEGDEERIEKFLNDYTLAIGGKKALDEVVQTKEQLIELRQQLRLAKSQIEFQRDMLNYKEAEIENLNSLLIKSIEDESSDTGINYSVSKEISKSRIIFFRLLTLIPKIKIINVIFLSTIIVLLPILYNVFNLGSIIRRVSQKPPYLNECKTRAKPKFRGNINIGIAIARTGRHRHIGFDQELGAKIAKEYLTDKYKDRRIFLHFKSAGTDVSEAKVAFTELMRPVHRNVAIIGPTLSDQAVEVGRLADQNCILMMAPSNTKEGIPKIGSFVSRVSAGVKSFTNYSISAAVSKSKNENAKSVAILFAEDDEFTKSEASAFANYSKRQTLNVLLKYPYSKHSRDFKLPVSQVLNLESEPDIVIISGLTLDGGQIVYELREGGYKGIIVGGNGLNTRQLFKFCRQHCNNVIIAQSYDHTNSSPINIKFREIYEEMKEDSMPKYPPQFVAQMFASVQVIVESINSIDKDISNIPLDELRIKLNEIHLRKNLQYNTPLGNIWFDSEGEVQQNQFTASEVKGVDKQGKGGWFERISFD